VTLETAALTCAALLLAFGLGYGFGRRQGMKEGFAAGLRWAPLQLRQESWEQGECVLCGQGCESIVTGQSLNCEKA